MKIILDSLDSCKIFDCGHEKNCLKSDEFRLNNRFVNS